MSKKETPIKDTYQELRFIGLTHDQVSEVLEWHKAKVEELQKENKHLKQVYEHRCNEVKDKVETIHNYLNQITQLQKEIESLTNKKEG